MHDQVYQFSEVYGRADIYISSWSGRREAGADKRSLIGGQSVDNDECCIFSVMKWNGKS